MTYDIVTLLKEQKQNDILQQLQSWGTLHRNQIINSMKFLNLHSIGKNAAQKKFIIQKLNYIHSNACVDKLCTSPEEYEHSSAKFYITNLQGIYSITSFMELRDINLTA